MYIIILRKGAFSTDKGGELDSTGQSVNISSWYLNCHM